MDGVILEGRSTDPIVYERAADLAISELDADPTDEQRARLHTYSYADVETACSELGIDPATFWERREANASRIANDRIQSGKRGVYDDVEALNGLADEAPLALVSNNRHETVSFVADFFRLPVEAARGRDPTPEGYRRRKPNPDYLREVLERLGARGGIYVGDRETDVVAARRAGIDAAYLRRPHNRDEPLPTDATYELESLADVASIVG